jgi:hypothetical protein
MSSSEESNSQRVNANPPTESTVIEAKAIERPKPKDVWDKSAIIVSATSSIILALAALLINSSIQRTQVDNIARASDSQIRSQNLKLTADLMQHLLSGDPLRQRMALAMLSGAIESNDELVVDVVRIIASTTKDPSVLEQATRTLTKSKNPVVAEILHQLYRSRATPEQNRDLAYLGSQSVAIHATLDTNTAILYAGHPGDLAFEDSALRRGVFTHFLLRALAYDSAIVQRDKVALGQLSEYLSKEVGAFTEARFGQRVEPLLAVAGAREIPLGRASVLAIGISKYADARASGLMYAAEDSRAVAETLTKRFAATSVRLDNEHAGRDAILAALESAAERSRNDRTFILYFSGHGWNIDGQQYLAAADVKFAANGTSFSPFGLGSASKGIYRDTPNQIPSGAISFAELQLKLSRIKASNKLVLIDACANNPFSDRDSQRLALGIDVFKYTETGEIAIPWSSVRAGDRVKLGVRINQAKYIYVLAKHSEGWDWIYPKDGIEIDTYMQPMRSYRLPAEPYLATRESVLYVVTSQKPLRNLVARISGKPAEKLSSLENRVSVFEFGRTGAAR